MKLYDLRQCKLSGQDASGFDLSGVIMTDTDVSKVKFVGFGRQNFEEYK